VRSAVWRRPHGHCQIAPRRAGPERACSRQGVALMASKSRRSAKCRSCSTARLQPTPSVSRPGCITLLKTPPKPRRKVCSWALAARKLAMPKRRHWPLERGFRISGCVQPCRRFAAFFAPAPILLERGACDRETDGPEITVAHSYTHGTIGVAVAAFAMARSRPCVITPVAG
jgi:hypothetical protein